jgi:hypothetical protein
VPTEIKCFRIGRANQVPGNGDSSGGGVDCEFSGGQSFGDLVRLDISTLKDHSKSDVAALNDRSRA